MGCGDKNLTAKLALAGALFLKYLLHQQNKVIPAARPIVLETMPN